MFLPLFAQVTEMHSELDEGQRMVNPLQLGSMLVDWMDPEKAVYVHLSHGFAYPLIVSAEKYLVGRKMIAFTSISLRILSKLCLMTAFHVRKIILPPTIFVHDITCGS